MRAVVQRVINSNVKVNNKIVGRSNKGILVLVGFTEGDNKEKIDYIVNKILNLRIFDDERGIMNLSIKDINGSILSISQFTLYGDASAGNRPSYVKALKGGEATLLFDYFNEKLKNEVATETGVFGAEMTVSLVNDGPVTIILER